MKIVVADTGTLISLGLAGKIEIIDQIFDEFYIPTAVWKELEKYENPAFSKIYRNQLKSNTLQIKSKNHLALLMD
jgi:predicted nucleic acid-binding protein